MTIPTKPNQNKKTYTKLQYIICQIIQKQLPHTYLAHSKYALIQTQITILSRQIYIDLNEYN